MKFGLKGKLAIFGMLYTVFVVMFIWVIHLKSLEIKKEEKQLYEIKERISTMKQLLSVIPEIERRGKELRRRMYQLLPSIPKRESLPDVLIEISELARREPIRILDIDIGKFSKDSSSVSFLKKVDIEMSIKGRYIPVGNYLFSLSKLPFFAGYDMIETKASQKDYPELEWRVIFRIYFVENVTNV